MSSPRLEVICVGTELLTGKVSTHVAYLGEKLGPMGLSIAREHTVSDDPKIMREVFADAWRRSSVVICAGGLGPTFDDITRDVWSKVVKRPLRVQSGLIEDIREKFRRRGMEMPPKNRRQAEVLAGAEVMQNNFGTAPGQFLQIGKKVLILFPGPARELYPMAENFALPRLKALYKNLFAKQVVLQIFGVPESKIDQMVRPLVARYQKINGCSVIHGILASQSIISVKFTVEGRDPMKVEAGARTLEKKFRVCLGDLVFGQGKDTVEAVVGNIFHEKKKTLALAESCTGGLIAKLLTDQAGSSDFFREGIVCYSNESKQARLGVKSATLKKYGAVSAQTAQEMAAGARKKSKTDYAVSVTGVAGPTGGTPEKPVGTVFIACAGPKRTVVRDFKFEGERAWIRHRSALMALDLLRRELLR